MYYLLRDKGLEKLKNLDFNEYIYDMPEKIASADVVICRAGAMSISEMAFSGKCAIFIPSPNVVDNHQYKNAYTLSSASAGILMAESEIYNLTDTVKELLEDDLKRQSYSKRIRTFSVKESNKIIYEEIRKLVKDFKSSRKN
jgi:UDP-N-acetylglucosamine--N-acetylmuramyl-(pentapeptide) pyrophosphoryl-undecaprenol N-acetylglucosamine transferase